MPTDIPALRELLAKATPGPWRSTWDDPVPEGRCESIEDWNVIEGPDKSLVVGMVVYDGHWPACTKENAALIVAAVNQLPSLLDELEGLREKLAAVEPLLQKSHQLAKYLETCPKSDELPFEALAVKAEVLASAFLSLCDFLLPLTTHPAQEET